MLEWISTTQEEQMAPELVMLEMALTLLLVRRDTVDGEHININAFQEFEVRTLEDGSR